jgi:hypothetical protein
MFQANPSNGSVITTVTRNANSAVHLFSTHFTIERIDNAEIVYHLRCYFLAPRGKSSVRDVGCEIFCYWESAA